MNPQPNVPLQSHQRWKAIRIQVPRVREQLESIDVVDGVIDQSHCSRRSLLALGLLPLMGRGRGRGQRKVAIVRHHHIVRLCNPVNHLVATERDVDRIQAVLLVTG